MIKVSVMYANKPGARFDHAYYRDKHMPLVKARMGNHCRFYTVDRGLAGMEPGQPATYVAMCHIYSDSVEAFQAGFGPHVQEIMADIPNYTDLAPWFKSVRWWSVSLNATWALVAGGAREAKSLASLRGRRLSRLSQLPLC